MSAEEAKSMYEALKESGELFNLFPSMTGDWKKDENSFRRQHNINEHYLDDDEAFDFDLGFDEL